MSGIAGIIDFDGAFIDPGRVEAMTAAMAHRGIDGIRHWRHGSVAIGHCLLCTTEESLEERQPLATEDEGLVLVMDGRLDNWEELRTELSGRGTVLRDRSDAELVLRAYQTWGRACLAHLDGDFALAIWDAPRQLVFCARDRMGRKPFNYYWDGKRLTFASELHAVLAMPWVPHQLNEGMLAEYLALEWYSCDETPWTGIRRLAPAHWMEIGRAGRQAGEYWQPELQTPVVYRNDDDYAEHYRHLLADAVRRTSRTHRPLACEVSGGLDSSAVFAVAADLAQRQALPAPSLSGFTLRFDDDSEANELDYARAVGAYVGVPVHEIDPTSQPLSWYREWARTYREFPGYPNGVMAWGIRKAASDQGGRALLVGAGGDEWLTGSRAYYSEELASGEWRHLYRSLSMDLRECGATNAGQWLVRSGAVVLLPAPILMMLRTRRQRKRERAAPNDDWLTPRLSAIVRQRATASGRPSRTVAFPRAGQAAMYATLHGAYDILAQESEERLAASLGVELRLPLATPAMVQFAFSTPERLRLQGRTIKALHRRAMQGLLPVRVLQRTSKADFMVTFRDHADELRGMFTADMRGSLEDWVKRPDLDAACDRCGDPASADGPDWRVWSLFGWSLLRSEVGT